MEIADNQTVAPTYAQRTGKRLPITIDEVRRTKSNHLPNSNLPRCNHDHGCDFTYDRTAAVMLPDASAVKIMLHRNETAYPDSEQVVAYISARWRSPVPN
jgi:hypothetical protein